MSERPELLAACRAPALKLDACDHGNCRHLSCDCACHEGPSEAEPLRETHAHTPSQPSQCCECGWTCSFHADFGFPMSECEKEWIEHAKVHAIHEHQPYNWRQCCSCGWHCADWTNPAVSPSECERQWREHLATKR